MCGRVSGEERVGIQKRGLVYSVLKRRSYGDRKKVWLSMQDRFERTLQGKFSNTIFVVA